MTENSNWYDAIVSNINTALEAVYLKKTSIADNLTTNDATKVLSAKQGKALKDEIGDISDLINGTGE